MFRCHRGITSYVEKIIKEKAYFSKSVVVLFYFCIISRVVVNLKLAD